MDSTPRGLLVGGTTGAARGGGAKTSKPFLLGGGVQVGGYRSELDEGGYWGQMEVVCWRKRWSVSEDELVMGIERGDRLNWTNFLETHQPCASRNPRLHYDYPSTSGR